MSEESPDPAPRLSLERINALSTDSSGARLIAQCKSNQPQNDRYAFTAYDGTPIQLLVDADTRPLEVGAWYEIIAVPSEPNVFTAHLVIPSQGQFDPKPYSKLLEFIQQDPSFFNASSPFRQ